MISRPTLIDFTWNTVGLTLFVMTSTIMMMVLAFDVWLDAKDYATITMFCRANPWAAWIVLVAVQMGVMGLAMHLMAIVPIGKD